MRGIAAICVAVFHYQILFSHQRFFDWGWICVDLFFLISGVVMMHVYEKRIEERSINFSEFLSHRIARLWPVHIVAMLSMLGLEILSRFTFGEHVMDWGAPVYTFLLNLVFLQNIGLHETPTWDGNAWSLTPELVANLIWFYLVTTKRLSSKLLFAAILCFSVLQYNRGGTINGLIFNSSLVRCGISYGIGCLLYRHFIANRAIIAPSRVWCDLIAAGLLGFIILIILDVNQWHSGLLANWDYILVLFVFPALTYIALQPGTSFNAVLSSRLLVFFGSISYCVYLFHVQVALLFMLTCAWTGIDILPPYKGILFLQITILLATLVWSVLEVPSRKALRNRLAPLLAKMFFDRY
jgi:peptidoglycan/LPS O-acetylase OafA/YrhL